MKPPIDTCSQRRFLPAYAVPLSLEDPEVNLSPRPRGHEAGSDELSQENGGVGSATLLNNLVGNQ